MATNSTICCDLDLADFQARLDAAGEAAGDIWETWGASDDLGPCHSDIMADYGIDKGFECYGLTRHSKERSVEARDCLYTFFESLPGRKLVVKDNVFITFRAG